MERGTHPRVTLTRKLNAILRNIHPSKVTVSRGMKLTKPVPIACGSLCTRLTVGSGSSSCVSAVYFPSFLPSTAFHLSVSVYKPFSVHRTYCFRIGSQDSILGRNNV